MEPPSTNPPKLEIPPPLTLERQETLSKLDNTPEVPPTPTHNTSLLPRATLTSYKAEIVGTHDEKEGRMMYGKIDEGDEEEEENE